MFYLLMQLGLVSGVLLASDRLPRGYSLSVLCVTVGALQYVQTIKMVFDITTDPQGTPIPSGGSKEVFLHITANTLTKV